MNQYFIVVHAIDRSEFITKVNERKAAGYVLNGDMVIVQLSPGGTIQQGFYQAMTYAGQQP